MLDLKLYQKALNHTLKSEITGKKIKVRFNNGLPVSIILAEIDDYGNHLPYTSPIRPEKDIVKNDIDVGKRYVAKVAATGAFCSAIEFIDHLSNKEDRSETEIYINPSRLLKPNALGKYPEPNPNGSSQIDANDHRIIIPDDSPRTLVGVGKMKAYDKEKEKFIDRFLTREQFWRRGNDSYVLAPYEKRTISITQVSGREETSSSVDTVSESISAGASGGWGAISASVSASLNSSSTSMQQLTVRTQETRYESMELTNKDHVPCMFLNWQLVDMITIFTEKYTNGEWETPKIEASIEQVMRPILVAGPYKFTN
jgi:hypothetical protein